MLITTTKIHIAYQNMVSQCLNAPDCIVNETNELRNCVIAIGQPDNIPIQVKNEELNTLIALKTQEQFDEGRSLDDFDCDIALDMLENEMYSSKATIVGQDKMLSGQFWIRLNRLHFDIVLSNANVVTESVFMIPWFINMQKIMLAALKPKYPGLELGVHTQIVHSLYLCRKNFEQAERILGRRK